MGRFQDLTGQRFGRLTVIERAEDCIQPNGRHRAQWLCRCDCGNEVVVRTSHLKSGDTKSCGCSRIEDLTGQRFGRLTVIERAEDHIQPSGKHAIQWLCRCDCGSEIVVMANNLKSGNTNSCGCLQKEKRKEAITKHGMRYSRIYKIWALMKNRCLNKNSNDYNDYGGRGIKVCDEWLEFEPFCKWSTENGYNDSLTIDRIDVNGNYEPSNCRWADMKTQQNNKRSNHYITYNGKTQTLSQWSEEFNINYYTLLYRINHGWSIDRAFNTGGEYRWR